ncbi:sensor domain-containing diguanylate cyclase [Roseospira marina]|nr:sensor domain-containing diguanylate cyclase [Roseospira marina]MBB4314293.1 diguanylate cyclase (GGDEF)-like protein/PAS domain S-box-containing protein [Roseospira marina]MBB5087453.1 diguanylate cyclase (GGDEF)-like protein/PAS domain S-box-containing protein [Roseospira marina]
MAATTKGGTPFRILVAASLIVLTMTVGGLMLVTSMADYAAKRTEATWADYALNVRGKIALLTLLEGDTGFTDLPNDLAAYVRTRDPVTATTIERRLETLHALVARYGALRLNDEERFALRALSAALSQYQDKLGVVRHMIERNIPQAMIADVVPLQGANAPMALDLLRESWTNADTAQRTQLSDAMARVRLLTRSTLLVVPVLILAALMVGWLAWRYITISREAERRREDMRRSEALYRDLVDGSLQGLLIHADFKLLFVNPAFARMFGFASMSDALTVSSFLELVEPTDRADLELVHSRIAVGAIHTWTGRVHCRNRRGDSIWVEEMARPIQWNGRPAVQMTLLDVTDRVAHEDDLEMERSLTEQQAQEVVALAEELDAALQLAEEQKSQLHRLSIADPLTGAFNRRHLFDCARQELARLDRGSVRALSVIMMDLDHFKVLNDTHGHAVGDHALRAFTVASTETLRENDVFARLGGEEFAALLPGTGLDEARVVAERLRERTADLRIALPGGKQIGLTVSLGVMEVVDPTHSFDAILSRVDAALYDSKRDGRNRVTVVPHIGHDDGHDHGAGATGPGTRPTPAAAANS